MHDDSRALDLGVVQDLDARDPLGHARARFRLPNGLVYLDGNSLGALPAGTPAHLSKIIEDEWGTGLIRSWNDHAWIDAPRRIAGLIAPLIGASADEVVVADSTSVNLFKLIVAAANARAGRKTILSEPANFPTDLYIAQGVVETRPDLQLRLAPCEDLIEAIDEDVAVLVLTHVHYRSGRKHDMAAITAAAQAKGALVIWDLSHSVGAVHIDLHACNADMAVGCGYKYLNGGPGAPAFLFVARRLHAELRSPLSGWHGHQTPFAFDDDYRPAPGIDRFLCGSPTILGMAGLEQGIRTFDGIDFDLLVDKSHALCALFITLIEQRCAQFGFRLQTPSNPNERGSHVSLGHDAGYPICQALIANNVVPDFRAPDTLRFGFTPLYTRYRDVWDAVEILHRIMVDGRWKEPVYSIRARVT